MGLLTKTEFDAKHVRVQIGNEFLSYMEICDRVYKLVEENYGKCKDGHFGFSMKYYKSLTENSIYDNYFTIGNFYEKYLNRIKYYQYNMKRIIELKRSNKK